MGLHNLSLFSFALTQGKNAQSQTIIAPPMAQNLIAPAGIWLTAPAFPQLQGSEGPDEGRIYDPSFHEITYIWTIRGKPFLPFTAPENLPSEWNDPNTAYGKKVAFCLSEPGRYIIDLQAIAADGGEVFASTDEIFVADPNEEFEGPKTVCVALDGDFDNKTPGALEASSIAELETISAAAPDALRVLFKRGEFYPDFAFTIHRNRLSYVGAWGLDENDPVIEGTFTLDLNHSEATPTFRDLEFQGKWDVVTQTGQRSGSPLEAFRSQLANTTTLFWNCVVKGYDISFNQTSGNALPNCRMMVANCVADGFRSNSIYTQNASNGGAIALIGNRIAQNPDAISGSAQRTLNAGAGPVRLTDNKDAYIAMNDMFSNIGAFALGADAADAACLRLNTSCILDVSYVVERNVCEGGYAVVQTLSSNSSVFEKPGNYLFDKLLMVLTEGSAGSFLEHGRGGTTFRNVYGYVPNVSMRYYGGSGLFRSLIQPKVNTPSSGNLDEPIRIYNCAILSEQSSSNEQPTNGSQSEIWQIYSDWLGAPSPFLDVTLENNIVHNPDSAKPSIGYAPIDAAQAISKFTSRYKGKRWNFKHYYDVWPLTTVPIGGTISVPYSDLSQELINGTVLGGPTTQAYWQAIETANTSHQLYCGRVLSSDAGDFTVSYADPAGVLITNTSAYTWTFTEIYMRLDRHTLVPPMDKSGQGPSSIPFPRILAPALTAQRADFGLTAYDDFKGIRRSTPKLKGIS